MSKMRRMASRLGPAFVAATLAAAAGHAATAAVTTYKVKPSSTDPAIQHDDFADWVMLDTAEPNGAPLVVFMPGTHGKPGNKHELALMDLIVAQGYRLAWISFDNDISVSKICPRDPNPRCSFEFRRMRVDGEGPAPVQNPRAESVVSRLTHLFGYLQREHPGQGWGIYLRDGKPDWSRIVVSGHSTGAGMAAYIAKTREVARVVLFSSPWDDVHPPGGARSTAPWLSMPSDTPLSRWYAAFHRDEDTAGLIAPAYAALGIPRAHVFEFKLGLPGWYAARPHHNPYHHAVIYDPRYAPQWRDMFVRVVPHKPSGEPPRP